MRVVARLPLRVRVLFGRDNRHVTAVGRVLQLLYAAFLRALAFIGGAIAAYGATGIFTSSGLMPPNPLVWTGLAATAIVATALWSHERRPSGLWPALAIARSRIRFTPSARLAKPSARRHTVRWVRTTRARRSGRT